ncbi:MAG: hypothetical protein QNL97_08580 [Pseudomonadales bacterium]
MRSTMAVMKLLISLLTLGLTISCTTNVQVEGSVPTPLVAKIPANVAVYYDENFKTFVHTEELDTEGTWNINLGEKNLEFFRNLSNAMFSSVTEVDSPELTPEQQVQFDGLIIPTIDEYGFLTPKIGVLPFYSVSIRYQVLVLGKQNQRVAKYEVVGYGKSEGNSFTAGDAVGDATMLAIRDGGQQIAVELRHQPAIIEWLKQRNLD